MRIKRYLTDRFVKRIKKGIASMGHVLCARDPVSTFRGLSRDALCHLAEGLTCTKQ